MPQGPLNVNIRLRGVADLQRKLLENGQNIRPDLERATTRAILYVQGQIPPYPPKPAGNGYRRTGTLGRTITAFPGYSQGRDLGTDGGKGRNPGEPLSRVETRGNNIVGIIGTSVAYAQYVIGEEYRRSGSAWWTLESVVRGAFPGIKQVYQDMVTDLIRRLNS
jgi:hypothetical protein